MTANPRFRLNGAATATPEQAAAIAAALERFMRATTPSQSAGRGADGPDFWRRVALLEGVSRECQEDVTDPWINT